jgi:methionine-rich copper-binding protein CopC
MRRILLACAALVAATGPVFAHAHLVTAQPATGSTVTTAPTEVVLSYTEGLEPKFSSIEVKSAAGAKVDKGDAHLVGGDAKRFAVGLQTLQPGTYTVVWHATSVDTHKTEGSFTFTVAK